MEPLVAVTLLGIALYFLPTFVALWRYHHQRWAIFLFNLFLGWTFLGWVIALVWAATQVQGRSVHGVQPPHPATVRRPSASADTPRHRYSPYDRP